MGLNSDQIFYCATRAYYWSKAVIESGQKALAHIASISSELHAFLDRIDREDDSSIAFLLMDQQKKWIEENDYAVNFEGFFQSHIFMNALMKALDYLAICPEFRSIRCDIISRIGNYEDVKDVRDMMEHDEAYILNRKPFRPKQFVHTGETGSIADAVSFIYDGASKEVCLGERIKVRHVIQIFEHHVDGIKEISDKIRFHSDLNLPDDDAQE